MDILLVILKYLGIILSILVILSILIFGIIVIKNIVSSALVINNIETLLLNYHKENEDQNYVWFEYMGDTGLGKVYNKGTKEDPNLFVLCIYSNNSVQHLPINKIEKYIPLKLTTFNTTEEEIILKHKKDNE